MELNFEKIENLSDENIQKASCLCIVQHHNNVKNRVLEIYNKSLIPLIYDCQHKLEKNLESKTILDFLGN